MPPSTNDFAKLTKYHYLVDKHSQEKAERKINKKLKNTDYELSSLTRGVANYTSRDKSHNIISLKGTSPTYVPDLVSDVKLAVGKSATDPQFKQRTNAIKNIYRDNPDKKHYLTSHSLGASTALHALTTSKSIRDNTEHAHLFNTGYTKAFHKEQRLKITAPERKQLTAKVTHHNVSGDIISSALKGGAVGKVETTTVQSADKHAIDNFVEE